MPDHIPSRAELDTAELRRLINNTHTATTSTARGECIDEVQYYLINHAEEIADALEKAARLDKAEWLLVQAKKQLLGNSVNHRTLREAINRFLNPDDA